MCLVMLFFLNIYLSFLFHMLLMASLDLTLFTLILYLRIMIVSHLIFLILQITLLMFFLIFLYIILDMHVRANSFANIDPLVFETPDTPSSPMVS